MFTLTFKKVVTLLIRYTYDIDSIFRLSSMPYYGGKRHLLDVPYLFYTILSLQTLLNTHDFPFEQLEWLKVFAVLDGIKGRTFKKIGINDKKLARHLIQLSSKIFYICEISLINFQMLFMYIIS